jgi:hypothetical protein
MQVLGTADPAQDNVADREGMIAERFDRAQLAALDLADHAVAARPELHGLAALEPCNMAVRPAHAGDHSRFPPG